MDEWLRSLPQLLRSLADQWNFTPGELFPKLSYNLVFTANRSDGSPAVLKLGLPNPELTTEIAALTAYNGKCAARLLAADAGAGAFLMERIYPGEDLYLLSMEDDESATSIAAGLMRRLWQPVFECSVFTPLERWTRALDETLSRPAGELPIPHAMVARAAALRNEMLSSAPEPVLLHGDFHHYNILYSQAKEWVALDPKGLCGDPAYDAAPFLINPWPDLFSYPDPGGITQRRLEIFSTELGIERSRLLSWAYVHAVLSACWSMQDRSDVNYPVACARILQGIM